ncbi:uncharacterized protein LOC122277118 [Carya illinoinensis]|uniref:uncharacterized protein LOC122277118 n=1 Tax=Carya illinoinensis TaxID=32201 RepID=UPI001C71905B|nr:uncharacterized protein LOC122277118 [Carya illinoinensis]
MSNIDDGGKIWVCWRDDLNMDLVSVTNQSITCLFSRDGSMVLSTFIYAKCLMVDRRQLWDHLCSFSCPNISWMVCGDFNIIRADDERAGGLPRSRSAMNEFNLCINSCGLLDWKIEGKQFSWCNGQEGMARSWAKLDRMLVNNEFALKFETTSAHFLERRTSDHAPLLVQFADNFTRYGPMPFHFQNMWVAHDEFLKIVESSWKEPFPRNGLLVLAGKLKRLKVTLKRWNKEVFGRMEGTIRELEERVEVLDVELQNQYTRKLECDFLEASNELDQWVQREDTRLRQQAKQRWMEEGDQNTKYFHVVIAQRRRNAMVKNMKLSGGRLLESPVEIHEEATRYFERFLSEEENLELPDLSTLISSVVGKNEERFLRKPPSDQEIYEALLSIPKDSSPGPDGFSSQFYLTCWEIVRMELSNAVMEFFQGMELPRFYTTSFIVLIPKVKDATSFDKFRPISLCNVIYKVFAKLIVNRLAMVLDRMISPEQGAFVKGRSIFQNISLSQEMLKLLHRNARGGNVFIKIDMSKAYDRVNWKFLMHVLSSFGVPGDFFDLIKNCVTTPWFSIMLNGTFKGFFKSKRGLRQGDPLSPYLFIIMEEVLSKMIKGKVAEKKIQLFSHPGEFPCKYLGAPIVDGRLKARHLDYLVAKVQNKLEGWKSRLLSQGGRLILLRHVLSSMPIHLLSVIQKPASVIKKLNSLFSGFFWGDKNGKVKRRWKAWNHMCGPVEEGGIGVRKLGEVQRSLFHKFRWQLLTEDSLWANFFRAKYVKNKQMCLWLGRTSGSNFWCKVVEGIPFIIGNSKWKVHEGDLSFWYDKFLNEGMLCDLVQQVEYPDIRIRELVINDLWDIGKLQEMIGNRLGTDVMETIGNLKNKKDVLIWLPNKNGLFSTTSAWDMLRVKGQVEDLDHVLGSGQFARSVWCKVSAELDIPFVPQQRWRERRRAPRIVKLTAPSLRRFKLNIDGSNLGNPGEGGGGGILRDDTGMLREANSVADLLAKEGATGVNKVVRNVGLLDVKMRGLYRLDKSANCLISGILPNRLLNERLRTDRKIRPSASCKGITPVGSLLDRSSDSRWLTFPKDDGIWPVKTLFDKLRTYNNLSTPNSSGIGPTRLLHEKSI